MNIAYLYKVRKPNGDRDGPEVSGEVFDTIARHTKFEPALLDAEPAALHMSYNDGYAVVALDDAGEPVGFTRLSFLLAEGHPAGAWMELGSTWVHSDYRGKGINNEMYRLILSLHPDKNTVATSINPRSLVVGDRFGFVVVPRRMLPPEVWQSSCCCPLSKTHATTPDNRDCVLAHGEAQNEGRATSCWFRVTRPTAARLGLTV